MVIKAQPKPHLQEEEPAGADRTVALVREFGRRIGQLLDEAGVPAARKPRVTDLATRFGVAFNTAAKWIEGEGLPNPVVLIGIADHFSVSIDWMLGRTEQRRPGEDFIEVAHFRYIGGPATAFEEMAKMRVPKAMAADFALSETHCLVSWPHVSCDPFLTDDLLVVDLAPRGLTESDYYLVRAGGLTTLRRIDVQLNHEIHVKARGRMGSIDMPTVYASQDVHINASGSVFAMPADKGLLVVGRITGFFRRSMVAEKLE